MKRFAVTFVCSLVVALGACTEVEFLDFLASLPPDFFTPPASVPPLEVEDAQTVEPDDVVGEDPERPTPLAAASFLLRVINNSSQTVDVTIRMILGGLDIRTTFLRLESGGTTVDVGPDLADTVIVSGVRADGTPTPGATFEFGAQFTDDTTRDFFFSDPPSPPAPDPIPEPEPEPEPEVVVEDPAPEVVVEEPAPPGSPSGDCNGNNVPDPLDVALGDSADCNTNGVPDECETAIGAECCIPVEIDEFVSVDTPQPGAGFIDEPGGFDCYIFQGSADQEIIFDALGASPQTESFCTGGLPVRFDWDCVGPGGVVVFEPERFPSFPDPVAILPSAGTYTITVQAVPGTFGFHSFRLREPVIPDEPEEPVFDNFNISIGDTVAVDDPGPGAGTIETPGSEDTYTFIAAGENVYFDVQSGNFNLRWACEDSDGTSLFSNLSMFPSNDPGHFALGTGPHTITVNSPFSTTGTYRFEIVSEPLVEVFNDIPLDERVAFDVPAPGAGQISSIGERDVFTFDVIGPPLEVYFDVDFNFSGEAWVLEDPNMGVLFDRSMSFGDPGRFSLDTTGTYTITVSNASGAIGGTYGFEIMTAPPPEVFPLLFDTPTTGALDNPFAVHEYQFTTSPASVYFNARDTTDFNIEWECRDSGGGLVFGPERIDPFLDPGAFDLDGDYSIFVSTQGEGGSYEIEIVLDPPINAFPLELDMVWFGDFTVPGQLDVYTFTAPPSGDVYFDAIFTESFGLDWACASTLGGTPVFPPRNFNAFNDPGRFTLNPDEDYFIFVASVSGEPDDYEFEVIAEAPPQAFPLAIGDPPVNGNLDSPLDVHEYTFTAGPSTRVYFDALGVATSAIRWRCDGGDEGVVFGEQNFFSDPGAFVLGGGDYTITVFTSTNVSGFYNFRLHGPIPDPQDFDINIGDAVAPDVPATGAGQTDGLGVTDLFHFSGSAGTRVYFDAITASDFAVTWECREDDTGNTVFGERSLRSSDPGVRTLNAGGTYTITVFNGVDGAADYEFELYLDNDDCDRAICAFEGFESFDSTFATPDGPADCAAGNDVWYEYVAPCSAQLTIDLCESSFDSVLAVYEGCACPPTELVACNDDACAEQSSITFDAVEATCYLIRVSGEGGDGGLDIRGCD